MSIASNCRIESKYWYSIRPHYRVYSMKWYAKFCSFKQSCSVSLTQHNFTRQVTEIIFIDWDQWDSSNGNGICVSYVYTRMLPRATLISHYTFGCFFFRFYKRQFLNPFHEHKILNLRSILMPINNGAL